MPGRPVGRRRYAQARRLRRFETERPSVRAIVREGTTWAAVNVQRLPGLALMLGCLALVAFLFGDPRFYVYASQVTGNHTLSAEAVYEASGTDMHSIFFVATSAVRQRLLDRFPGLADARVSLRLPALLSIHVVERKARFVWEAGGQVFLVDERGTVIGGSEVAPPDALLIRCTEGCTSPAGQTLDPAVLDTALRLSNLLGGQRSFEYSPRFGVSWRTGQGSLVHFGVGGDLQQKVVVMRSMLAELAGSDVKPQFLDVGVPSRPYYR